MIARLPDGEIQELVTVSLGEGTRIRSVDWGPDGQYVYFTETTEEGGTLLKRLPVTGGEPEVVWDSPEGFGEFTISPTGDRVAYTRGENKGDTYIMENLKAALQGMREGR